MGVVVTHYQTPNHSGGPTIAPSKAAGLGVTSAGLHGEPRSTARYGRVSHADNVGDRDCGWQQWSMLRDSFVPFRSPAAYVFGLTYAVRDIF
jgi:hypothetical protein